MPLAKPVPYVDKDTVFEMDIKTFGEADGKFMLYSDDFETFDFETIQNTAVLEKHPGKPLEVIKGNNLRYSFNGILSQTENL